MRRVTGEKLGSLDDFHIVEAPVPEPGPGEIRIRVGAVGLGFVDGLIVEGKYQVKPPLPYTPGGEIAGFVDALGDGVEGFAPGSGVIAWTYGGGLADYCLVPAAAAIPIPDGVDPVKAAALITNYQTVLHALKDRAALEPGETLLVLGASGGVGVAAIEVARLLGARIIAAASTAEKRAYAKSVGAHETVDYTAPDWRDALKALTGGAGIDVVLDPVGGQTFEAAFRSLAWRGRHLVVGFAGGPIPVLKANLALLKGAGLLGVEIRHFASKEKEKAAANLGRLFAWVRSGEIKVPVDTAFALADFKAAMEKARSGNARGKVVVVP